MAFFDDIRNLLPINRSDTPVQLIDNTYAVINGHRGLKVYTDNEIVFVLKKTHIKIIGDDLKIVYLSDSEGYIQGIIKGVLFDEN